MNTFIKNDYLVYSSHKTATQTLLSMLQTNGYHAKHCHKYYDLKHTSSINVNHIHFSQLVDHYNKRNNRKLKIITCFRNPLDRLLSSYFQTYGADPVWIHRKTIRDTIIYKKSPQQIVDDCLRQIKNRTLPGYTESIHELCRLLNIPLVDINYDKTKLFSVYENNRVIIYFFRFDNFINNSVEIIKQITGKQNIIYNESNLSENHWYSEKYKLTKQIFEIPEELKKQIVCDNEYLLNLFF